MKKPDYLSLIGELLKQLAEALVAAANSDGRWDELFLDVRYEEDVSLKRFVTRNGSARTSLQLSDDAGEIETKLWQLRGRLKDKKWHGLFIRIDANGNVDVKYNYDPLCISTFADDELSKRPF